MNRGRALELFFVEGDPEGMATAEVVNWTGHVLRVPRNAIKAALKRPEAGQTGKPKMDCPMVTGKPKQ